jgi:hypothetical protein
METTLSEAPDFWLSCGHHLLDRDASGRLVITDEFLKAYLARPELVPPPDACEAECAIHRDVLANPRMAVAPARLAAVVDPDARDNWEILSSWRDHLIRHVTLEAAYLDIVRHGRPFPSLLINQLVQVILRNVLDGCDDAFVPRAAELFFRPQKLAAREGVLVCADEETMAEAGIEPVSPLSSLLGLPAGVEMTVLNQTNAHTYWGRSDAFDLALELTAGRRGLAALGEVMTRWLSHLLSLEVEIVPVTELRDATFRWYVGLDAEATRFGDSLWAGEVLDEATQGRLVALYRLNFIDSADMDGRLGGVPMYLIMAMTKNGSLRLKPQNLLNGLPIRRADGVT